MRLPLFHPHTVFLLGASRGIGKALALEYAGQGAALVLGSRDVAALEHLVEIIRARGGKAWFVHCDARDHESVLEAVAFADRTLGEIELAILNAGVGGPDWMASPDLETARDLFAVNTFGILHGIKALVPPMRMRGGGVIAGVSSLADVRGYPGSGLYSASKAAATVLLEAARVELRPLGIRVVTIRPGFVRTAMTAKNEFRMPFIMEPERAARIIRRGIERGKSMVRFPFPLVLASGIARVMPSRLFDRVLPRLRGGLRRSAGP
ncbi:MAG: SDR family NAD(P)-dependent oxidoreductase [Bacteroidota bacterium]|nr:SDR family NAD(P)-dependent oxidoreductase [Bacteroidota bacterium]